MMDPFEPVEEFFLASEHFPVQQEGDTSEAGDDDVLKYLNFSDHDEDLPALPASPHEFDQLLYTIEDSSLPDMNIHDVPASEDQIPAGNANGNGLGLQSYDMMEIQATEPPAWVHVSNLDCSCCHVLREVVHSNGVSRMKLALHGGFGVFDHAILDVFYSKDGFPQADEHCYMKLNTQTYDWVKRFLLDYGLTRKCDKYVVMQDTISAAISSFIDALCETMSNEDATTSGIDEAVIPQSGLSQSRAGEVPEGRPVGIPKSKSATQRERTKNMTLKDLVKYFHLPMSDASKTLDLCATALKKTCRRQGVLRWPHRKIKSIDRKISNLQDALLGATADNATRIESEIKRLKAERAEECGGVSP